MKIDHDTPRSARDQDTALALLNEARRLGDLHGEVQALAMLGLQLELGFGDVDDGVLTHDGVLWITQSHNVRIWRIDWASGVLQAHVAIPCPRRLEDIALHPRNPRLLAVLERDCVSLWDLDGLRCLRHITLAGEGRDAVRFGEHLAFSPDGTNLAIFGHNGDVGRPGVVVWEVAALLEDRPFQPGQGLFPDEARFGMTNVCFTSPDTLWFCGLESWEAGVLLPARRSASGAWQLDTQPIDFPADRFGNEPYATLHPHQPALVLSDGTDGTMLWSLDAHAIVEEAEPWIAEARSVTFGGPEHAPWCLVGDGNTVAVHDAISGALKQELDPPSRPDDCGFWLDAVGCTHRDVVLVSGPHNTARIELWQQEGERFVLRSAMACCKAEAVSYSITGHLAMRVRGADPYEERNPLHIVQSWSLTDRCMNGSVTVPNSRRWRRDTVHQAFLSERLLVLEARNDRRLTGVDVERSEIVHTWDRMSFWNFDCLELQACSWACSPKGGWVATGREGGELHILQATARDIRQHTVLLPADLLNVLAFSPDGTMLIVGATCERTRPFWLIETATG
ncbi:MAG: WD40 repeat domain-containing protein, partial [Myxococcota bacterium]